MGGTPLMAREKEGIGRDGMQEIGSFTIIS